MRAQIEACVVVARSSLDTLDLHLGCRERALGTGLIVGEGRSGQHVAINPLGQKSLHVGTLLERADFVKRYRLEIMREARDRQEIWQVGTQPLIRLRGGIDMPARPRLVILQRM